MRTEMLTSRIGRPSGIDEKRLVGSKPLHAEPWRTAVTNNDR
jgi:hypothetical protein